MQSKFLNLGRYDVIKEFVQQSWGGFLIKACAWFLLVFVIFIGDMEEKVK